MAKSTDTYKMPGGKPAKNLYEKLAALRESALRTARLCAAITIPSLYPPEGSDSSDFLGEENQSISAGLVNTLGSALMYAAFPPNLPFMKYSITETALSASQTNGDDPQLISKTNLALQKRANSHRTRADATPLRGAYGRYAKLCIVGGNVCFDYTEIDAPVFYDMRSYVVLRDGKGNQLCVIIKKEVMREEIPDETLAQYEESNTSAPSADSYKPTSAQGDDDAGDDWDIETIPVYRVCFTDPDKPDTYHLWEELEDGTIIPDTSSTWTDGARQLHAAWMIPVYGSNWGRSYVQELWGDHVKIDNLSASSQDTAAAIATAITTVKPGATNINDVREAENLDVIPGNKDDVGMLTFNKSGDLAAIENALSTVERRLGRFYMSNFSIQRDAERVTKAEWDALLGELNKAMGGLYAEVANNIQLPIVLQFLHLHSEEEAKTLPPLPKDVVKIGIRTGADALGEDMDASNLKEWRADLNELMTPQVAATKVNDTEVATRLAIGRNINTEGLLVSDQQQQANKQNAMGQNMLESAAPHIAKAGAQAVFAQAAQQQADPQQQQG